MKASAASSRRLFLAALLAGAVVGSAGCARERGFQSLATGSDLSQWEGQPGLWSAQDGVITGRTTSAQPIPNNTFLIWKGGTPANFELRLSFRFQPTEGKVAGNSGIQYRSRVLDAANWVVGGYQADIDAGSVYLGQLYEEKGRGILAKPGEKVRLHPGEGNKPKIESAGAATALKDFMAGSSVEAWNELVIIARDNHLQHFVNGQLAADIVDLDSERAARSGVIALQLHRGPPMTVQFKDLRLATLP